MSEHLRALIVIIVLATVVFAFAKASACAVASTTRDFGRRRNLWFAITLAAFLAHNFWIFIVIAAVLLLFALPSEPNKLAMYYFLLFAVPKFPADISGLGIMNYIFTIDYVRLLALAVLLPAFLHLRKQPDTERFGRLHPDKFIAGYIIINFVLLLSGSTYTDTLRQGAFYAFIDIFLPYYVASRSIRNLSGFRDALMGFVLATLVLAATGVFEFVRHWLLYSDLERVLQTQRWGYGRYLERGQGSTLRALASVGQPIVLGYVMAVGMGFFLYLRKSVTSPLAWHIGLVLLIAGLIASLSRGPWIGAAAMLLVFVAMGPYPGKQFVKLGLLGLIVIPVLLVSPAGQGILDYLPFVGTVDMENVTYRQRLFRISIQVIAQNPFFGAYDFMSSPAMKALIQGDGIIDLVNSYLAVCLGSGLVGLSLFTGFFIAVAIGIFKCMRSLPDRNEELYLLGRVLFSTLLGILVIIFTVSSITVIPVVYWSVAGLGVAYARMLALVNTTSNALKPLRHAPFLVGGHKLNR